MGRDLMQNFEELNKCLLKLGEAQIIDYINHIQVSVSGEAWKQLLQTTTVMSNLSMICPKSVNILTNDGKKSVWWTKGLIHNPNGPSLSWHGEHGYQEKYTDEDGFNHRTDGPSFVSCFGGVYEEEWKIRPDIHHRVGGPAHTVIVPGASKEKTWGDLVEDRHIALTYFGGSRKFKPDTRVHQFEKRTQEWLQHGRPKNEGARYTEMLEEDVVTITTVTPSLIPVTHTFIRKLSYLWHDEDGYASRGDGPAHVILHNVVKIDHGSQKKSFDWASWDGNWFCRDQPIDQFRLHEWVETHEIELTKNPPVERSIFAKKDDAFCFLTDFYGKGKDVFGEDFKPA